GASAMPSRLIERTTQAAVAFNAGTLTSVAADGAQNLLRTLAVKGVAQKLWWMMLACIGTFGLGGIGWVSWKMFGDGATEVVPAASKPEPLQSTTKTQHERMDLYGDPLPEGAISRIGTIRFRTGCNPRECRNEQAVFFPDGKTLASIHG